MQIQIKADSRHSQLSTFIKLGGNSFYRILTRKNYRIPKNYLQWHELASLVALMAEEHENHKLDLAQRFAGHRHALWMVQDAPIYCLDKDLQQLFSQTDVGDESAIFKDLITHLPIHSLMLLLPNGGVRSPDGSCVDYLNIHCSDVNHQEWSTGEKYGLKVKYLAHEHDTNIHFGAIDTQGTVWFSGWGINADGKLEQRDGNLGRTKMVDLDKKFLRDLRNIVMQSLMFLSFEQTGIETVTYKETIGHGFATQEPKERCFYPRWLRLQEKSQVSIDKGGSHASPSPHWRRGHWRRSAVGEGRVDRKWNWIQPVFVGN
ncbi:hypothetical protein [Anabaena sp. CCY 9910]|uniref:hypothetical protein n=1 Tax=Anabaena sp. CCY 9910 TaxID=3103870 RepID=UPI0039E01CFF